MHACIAKHRIKIVSWFLNILKIIIYMDINHAFDSIFIPRSWRALRKAHCSSLTEEVQLTKREIKFTTKKERELLKPSSQNKAKNVQLKFDFDPVLSELNQQR